MRDRLLVGLLTWWAAVAVSLGMAVLAQASTSQTHQVHLSAAVVSFWERVGSCETGGGGPALWDWGAQHRPHEGHTYQGGVGMYWSTWRWWAGELGLLARYPNAYDAPKLVQVRVADMGYVVHHGDWGSITNGCAGRHP